MTTTANERPARLPMVLVRGALIACIATASAGRVMAQTNASVVEVGPGAIDESSYKAAEYNGLQNKGANAIGNVDWRGGSAGYNSDTTTRWRIKGTDLGFDTRNVSADVASQGKFHLNFAFDQLRRNRSDTFQTPYTTAGSSSLLLPGNWMVPTVAGSTGSNNATNVVSVRGLLVPVGGAPYLDTATNSSTMGAVLTPTAAQLALVNAAAAADLPAFHTVDIYTKRTRFDAALTYNFDPKWSVDASFRPEHKSGLKPMGTVSRNTGGDISTTIPDVVDADHSQMNVAMNFKGAKSFAQAAYYGSVFQNNVASMSWQNWATPTGTLNTMSTAPSNNFNQLSLTGGVNLTKTTKLVADGSYGRSTQNEALLTDSTTPIVPVSSLNALVIYEMFNARLTARPSKKVNLTANYKFDNRDNRTPVNIYQYADAGEPAAINANFPAGPNNPLGPVLAQNANANRPYSRMMNQAAFDAERGFGHGQWIKGGYTFERLNRDCSNTWISCADAAITNENTGRAEWRATGEDVTARINYAYSARRTPSYNENAFLALVPYANIAPASAAGGATAYAFMIANGWTGWGPANGYAPTTGNMNLFFPSNNALANAMYANNNRISELPGMRRYYVADRDRNNARAGLSWQANTALAFDGKLDLTNDHYPNATYGLQDGKGWAADFDTTYAISDVTSFNLFYTYEHQRSLSAGNSYTANSNVAAITNGQPGAVGLSGNSCDSFATMQQRNNNNKLDPCLNWSADMLDKVHTGGVGLSTTAGRVNLGGTAILSRSRWDNNVTGGSWNNNIVNGPGGAPTTIAAFFIPATPVPTVTTDTAELRVSSRVAIDKLQSLHLQYSYLRMRSNDLAYEGMQIGSLSGVLPSNEQPFNYSVNVFGFSYVLSF